MLANHSMKNQACILILSAVLCLGATSHAQSLQISKVTAVDGMPALNVESPFPCPVVLTLRASLTNMAANPALPLTIVLPPLAKRNLITFRPIVKAKEWNWDYTYQWQIGDPSAKHDDRVSYRLPYSSGEGYRVQQGFHGEFSHMGALEYATDWKMPVGSRVCAARDGIVVGIKADSDEGGPDHDKYAHKANYVSICHADGTIGEYLHLSKDGVRVRFGQKVKAGDWIALTGNTGFSSQPHLHFHTYIRTDATTFRTVPIRFQTANESAAQLKEGIIYVAR